MISLALHHLLFQPSAGAVDRRSRTRIRCFGWWPIKFAHARKRQPSRLWHFVQHHLHGRAQRRQRAARGLASNSGAIRGPSKLLSLCLSPLKAASSFLSEPCGPLGCLQRNAANPRSATLFKGALE
jgi:hypothetical protein